MKNIYTVIFCSFTLFLLNDLQAQCFADQNFPSMGTFSYTLPGSSSDTFVIEINCEGADGAPSLLNGTMPNLGGGGASMTAQYELYGGDELTVFVGQAGQTGGNPAGGGGAGGSAVVVNSASVLIAAGGGGGGGLGGASGIGIGAGANTNSAAQGGAAPGASGGGGFNAAGASGVNSTGGGAGTLTSIGAGGMNGVVAGMGGIGWGGGGGGAGTVGGGGGGYQGGDGGAMTPQGGGGGDSYVNSGFNSSVIAAVAGVNGGGTQSNGSVLITCISASGGNPPLVAMIDASVNPDCGGSMNGSITASATGGLPPYEYAIDGVNFSSNNVFTGLGAGPYTITVMDADGMTATASTTLTAPTAVTGSIVAVVDNVCFGGMSGSIEIAGAGGTAGYMYSIDGINFQTSGLFENLTANSYTITIQDANGCEGTVTASVGEAMEIVAVPNVVNVLCFGEATGVIIVDVAGSGANYLYSLDGINFQSSGTFTNLIADDYAITVQNALGCQRVVMATLDQPDALILTANGTNAGCGGQGGSIIASASGGTAPYFFTLNDTINSTDGIFENLPAGNYEVEVVDVNGCIQSTMVTINMTASGDPIALDLVASADISCHGGMDGFISVVATGGTAPYIYSLDTVSQADGIFEMLGAGLYTIFVADSAGCSTSIQVELTQPDVLVIDIDTLVHVRCASDMDGMAQFSATGGVAPYTFLLNGSINSSTGTFTNLSAGTYSIQVTDANLCVHQLSFTINSLNQIQLIKIGTVDNLCFGENNGSVTVVIMGNTPQYEVIFNGDTMMAMNNDTITFDNLSAGQHDVIATDIDGCSTTRSITINQPDELVLSVANYIAPTDTTNGEITLSAIGGVPTYEYSIDTGATYQTSPTFLDLPIGDYQFVVRDSNGCLNTVEYIISSIADIKYLNNQIELFPNPTSDFIEIQFANSIDVERLSIYDQLGRLTYAQKVNSSPISQEELKINCTNYLSGIYYAKIQTNSGMAFKQFIVAHE